MATTVTNDISRMLDIQNKKVYFDVYNNNYPSEYPGFTNIKKSTQQTEKYDTVGNLKDRKLRQRVETSIMAKLPKHTKRQSKITPQRMGLK